MAKSSKGKSNDGLFKAFSNLNLRKWLLASLMVFIAIYLLDMLVHGYLLKNDYVRYARMFLPQAQMMARMPYMLGGQILFALLIVFLYSQGYTGKGSLLEGVRYGVYLGLLINLPSALMSYCVFLFPVKLIINWAVYGTIQTIIYGGITGAIYKK